MLLSFMLADSARAPTTGETPLPATSPIDFIAVDVFVDPHGKPLACYQAQISASAGDATLVGVAGGDAATFNEAPYYDPRALQSRRIILGAYSLAPQLPVAPTHVATLMLRVNGTATPHLDAGVMVAGSTDGKQIPADVTLAFHSRKRGAGR
jgi:hypothetical protein